jgi:predicted MFS family arabinose efflux permease
MTFSSAANQEESIPRSAIVALSIAAFGSGMSMRAMDPLLLRLSSDFNISLGSASFVITVFGVAYGFSQLVFGPLGDRYGKYLVISWACIACALTSLLCGLAPDFQSLLVARAIAGATAAAVIPLSMAWIGDVVPYEKRQPVLARFLIGQILGLSSGALVGGLCADYLSWRAPFFMISLTFISIGFYLVRLNRSLPARARLLHKAEGSVLTRLVSEFSQIFALRWARVVLGTVMLEGATVFGAMAFVPSHLHATHGISLAFAGTLVMLFGMGGLLFAARSRQLVTRLGEPGLARYGALLMTASLLLIAYAPAWGWVAPACFFYGLGFYMLHNTLQINATQMAPERRGAAVAAFAACFFLGQSAGVATGGALLAFASTRHLLAVAGLCVALIGLNFARLRVRHT